MGAWGNSSTPGYAMTWTGMNAGSYQVASFFSNFPGGTVTDVYVYVASHAGMGNTNMQLCIWTSGGQLVWNSSTLSVGAGSGSIGGQSWVHVSGVILKLTQGAGYFIGFWRDPSGSAEWSSNNSGYWEANSTSPAGSLSGNSWYQNTTGQIGAYVLYNADQPPNTPTLQNPSANAVVNTQTPTFQGTFSDPTSGDYLAQYEIQVQNSGGSIVWDSGNVAAASQETQNAQFSCICGTSLTFGQSYSWRARVANQNGLWSSFAAWQGFSAVNGPNLPANLTPSGQQTTLTPSWSFVYSSPASAGMTQYRMVIESMPSQTWIYDTGWVVDSVASGATVSGTIPANICQWGQSYSINFMVQDTNSAQSGWAQTGFTIAPQPTLSTVSPVGGAIVTTQTPTYQWSYSDPNYAQVQFQVQIINSSSGAIIQDSGVVNSAANQYTSTISIAYNTNIQWRVQVWDSAGINSGYTSYASAYVNNAPSATITAPANNATITTDTPTLTWTYTASTGGQLQASALITLQDTNGHTLGTYSVTGTGTSYTFAGGILVNGSSYVVFVAVTDTASETGTSASVTFTLSYPAPADMQGQPVSATVNYILSPHMNQDSGTGRPVGFGGWTSGTGSFTLSIDPSQVTPLQLASGDGPIMGAHAQTILSNTGNAYASLITNQSYTIIGGSGPQIGDAISVAAYMRVQSLSGQFHAHLTVEFINSSWSTLSSASGALQYDTAGQFVWYLGPQNAVIPANTAYIRIDCYAESDNSGETGIAWWCDLQLENSPYTSAACVGDLGTGYLYDSNGYSHREFLAGNAPYLIANAGQFGDSINALGGSLILTWDTTLADSRFTNYLIERRLLTLQTDDTMWEVLATPTSFITNQYVDFSAGSTLMYQYSVRQQIMYTDGSTGISAHRAIVVGSVDFSPAWYLSNDETGTWYNMRLDVIATQRQLVWKERAQYSAFLGRIGMARDAGSPEGYAIKVTAYFDDAWGFDRYTIRRQLVTMQQLNVVWSLKDSDGLVIPVYLQDITFDEEDVGIDTMMTVALQLLQAQDTQEY